LLLFLGRLWYPQVADLVKACHGEDLIQESFNRERVDWGKDRGELLAKKKSMEERGMQIEEQLRKLKKELVKFI
jgi:hypothetical protein